MKAKLIFLLTVILSLTSCQKYEDFIEDYDYSTTYFAYQRPIRTVFSDDPSIIFRSVEQPKTIINIQA